MADRQDPAQAIAVVISRYHSLEPLRLEIDVADREDDCVAVLEQQKVSRDFRCGLRNLGWLVFDAYLFRLRRIYAKLKRI